MTIYQPSEFHLLLFATWLFFCLVMVIRDRWYREDVERWKQQRTQYYMEKNSEKRRHPG